MRTLLTKTYSYFYNYEKLVHIFTTENLVHIFITVAILFIFYACEKIILIACIKGNEIVYNCCRKVNKECCSPQKFNLGAT